MEIHKLTEVVHYRYLNIKANDKEIKTILGALLYSVHRMEKHNNKAHILKDFKIDINEIKEIILKIQTVIPNFPISSSKGFSSTC